MNSRMSAIVCARSPVAIGMRVALPHARERRGVFRRHRLLDPFRVVRLEHRRHADRGRRREAAVHLDQNLHVGTDRVAHGRDDRHGAAPVRGGSSALARAERIELERRDSRAPRPARASARDRRRLALAPDTSRSRRPARGRGNVPPSSFQTGTPSDCPIRSQHAMSKAASADCVDFAGPSVLGPLHVPGEPLDVEGSAPMT